MRNICLRIAYDGTNYRGWQVQKNGPSVQAEIEEAIARLTRERSPLIAAGRTDAGVHAVGQVAHFLTRSRIPCNNIRRGLQNFLPHDITILEAEDVPESFHARYHATRKRYRYVIDNSLAPLPFLRQYAYQIRGELDVEAMHEAGQRLVGTHDFRCFESHWPNRSTSVRTVMEVTVSRQAVWPVWGQTAALSSPFSPSGDFICFDVVADGFLYNMVRTIVGTLLKVGRGKWTAETVAQILAHGTRADAGDTAPAHGLYLIQVDYEPPASEEGTT